MVILRCCFVEYGREMHGNSCCTCSMSIFPFLTNNILPLWHCRSRSSRLCLNSLLSCDDKSNANRAIFFIAHPFRKVYHTRALQFKLSKHVQKELRYRDKIILSTFYAEERKYSKLGHFYVGCQRHTTSEKQSRVSSFKFFFSVVTNAHTPRILNEAPIGDSNFMPFGISKSPYGD